METSTKPKTTRPRKNPGPAPAAPDPAPAAYHLTPATAAAVARRAELLGVAPAVVVEIAVAQWLQQQA